MNRSTFEIWDQFSQRLKSYITRRVADPEDAEDILQEVFVKIHLHIDSLQNDERLTPWLYRIARNAIIDFYRARTPQVELSDTLPDEQEFPEEDPEEQLASGLQEMLQCLPEKYRQALLLTEIKGLTQQEMAERLGLSLSGAKSRVQRGRGLLRQAFLDCCHFEFDRRGRVIDYLPRPDCCRSCNN